MEITRQEKIATPYGFASKFQLDPHDYGQSIISLTDLNGVLLSHTYTVNRGTIIVESDIAVIIVII